MKWRIVKRALVAAAAVAVAGGVMRPEVAHQLANLLVVVQ